MNKELNKVQKLIENFIVIHKRKAKYHQVSSNILFGKTNNFLLRLSEISPPEKYSEKDNKIFQEMRERIIRDYQKFSSISIDPFIFFHDERNDSYNPLQFSQYLKILEKSDNIVEYWNKLKPSYSLTITFSKDGLKDFCNRYILSETLKLINIKDANLGYESSYAYEGEEEKIKKIEKSWQEKDYRKVIDDIDTLFELFWANFSKQYLNKELIFKQGEKPKQIEEIIEELANRCKVPIIKDNLNDIVKGFKFMRDKLKPKIPLEKDKENWEAYNKLSEKELKLYTKISIDLAKILHNILVILQKEKQNG